MLGNKVTYSEPSIQYLQHVLEMVSSGTLRIPRFQRPFIWLEDRQLELMRSIREGIPIGALMIWRTTSAPVTFYEKLGAFPLNINQNASPQQYLLDGVQRITTLYGAFSDWQHLSNFDRTLDAPERALFFSFTENDFTFSEPNRFNADLMPLSIIFKTMELIKFQRNLADAGHEEWIEISSDLASRFKDYKIPLLSINTDDLSIATSTFQRVNTQGAKMSDFHMIHALTWTNDFDLQDELQSLKSEILSPILWESIDDEIILKVCKGLHSLNLYKTEPKAISKLIRDEPRLLERAVFCVKQAAKILKTNMGIATPDFVPYAFQIIFLSIACETEINNEIENDLIENWLWFTTYTEAFSGMSDDKVKRALSDFLKMLTTESPTWSNITKDLSLNEPKDRFDFRSVRSKATLLALARRYGGSSNDGLELLGSFGRSTIHQLYTRGVSSAALNSPGNKIFLPPGEATDFRLRFDLGMLSEDECYRHFIDQDALAQDPQNIISARARKIAQHEAEFASRALEKFALKI